MSRDMKTYLRSCYNVIVANNLENYLLVESRHFHRHPFNPRSCKLIFFKNNNKFVKTKNNSVSFIVPGFEVVNELKDQIFLR